VADVHVLITDLPVEAAGDVRHVLESYDIGEAQILLLHLALIVHILLVYYHFSRSLALLIDALLYSFHSQLDPPVMKNCLGSVVPNAYIRNCISLQ